MGRASTLSGWPAPVTSATMVPTQRTGTPAVKPTARRAVASGNLRRTGRHVQVVGHRGASASVPENTLPAFQAAWDGGAVWVEADTQPTADGVPVILHDADLDRTTLGSGPVRSLTAADQATVPVLGSPGAGVPALWELLGLLTRRRRVLLEIKGEHTPEQLAEVLRVSGASGHDGRVFIESFEVSALRAIRSFEPARPLGLLVERPHPDPVGRCRELGATAYNPDYREVLDHPDLVPVLHRAGIAVAVWTCDDPADWQRLTDAGVDAIITNTPHDLLAWQGAADG